MPLCCECVGFFFWGGGGGGGGRGGMFNQKVGGRKNHTFLNSRVLVSNVNFKHILQFFISK